MLDANMPDRLDFISFLRYHASYFLVETWLVETALMEAFVILLFPIKFSEVVTKRNASSSRKISRNNICIVR